MIRRILGAALGFAAACAQADGDPTSALGGWEDIDWYLDRLANSPAYAVLVVAVEGSDDFVQFSASDGIVQMDFPLVTPAQQRREGAIREFFERRGYTVVENRGSDGSRFLDWESSVDINLLAALTRAFLLEVFGADPESRLRFDGQGLAVAP